MGWWFLPIAFWTLGMILMLGGKYFMHKIRETKEHLHHRSKHAQHVDTSSSVYFAIGEKVLDTVPWVSVQLFYIVLGIVVFVLGFIALTFVL